MKRPQPVLADTGNHSGSQIPWLLLALAALATALTFTIANTGGSAQAFGPGNESPPPLPMENVSPLPDPPVVETVSPAVGLSNRIQVINIFGENFRPESTVFLIPAVQTRAANDERGIPVTATRLTTLFVDKGQLSAKVPAGLRTGVFHIAVWTNHETELGKLARAYTVLTPQQGNTDDLTGYSQHLWNSPHKIVAGESVSLGLKVRRIGGNGGSPSFFVNFYAERDDERTLIGRGFIAALAPNSSGSTSAVSWTPSNHGTYEIVAVIDPENTIAESNEDNNEVRRQVKVRYVRHEDSTPPVAESLSVNGGVQRIASTQVQLEVQAIDSGPAASGVDRVLFVELHSFAGIGKGSGFWVPVKFSEWLPYTQEPIQWRLHPEPGLRFLQAWVADRAGNISSNPAVRRITYVNPSDTLLAGEIRVYREDLNLGQCMHIIVEPSQPEMDADLYVWKPDGTLAGFSTNGAGLIDEVRFEADMTGTYQIEVEGFTHVEYQIQIRSGIECAAGGSGVIEVQPTSKVPRSTPWIPTSSEPSNDASQPEPLSEHLLFLADVRTPFKIGASQSTQLYLPAVQSR